MQHSQPDLIVAPLAEAAPPSLRRVLAPALGAGLLVLALGLCSAAPAIALLLGLLGLVAVGFGQVKGQAKRSFRSSLRAAVMVSARMDSIADTPPPSSVGERRPR